MSYDEKKYIIGMELADYAMMLGVKWKTHQMKIYLMEINLILR